VFKLFARLFYLAIFHFCYSQILDLLFLTYLSLFSLTNYFSLIQFLFSSCKVTLYFNFLEIVRSYNCNGCLLKTMGLDWRYIIFPSLTTNSMSCGRPNNFSVTASNSEDLKEEEYLFSKGCSILSYYQHLLRIKGAQ